MSRRRSAPRAAAGLAPVLALLLFAVPTPAPAQRPPPPAPPAAAFGERVDVVLVEVESVVVDRQGRRVAGLGRDDFRLLVDGAPVEIAVFEEVRGGEVVLAEDGPGGGAANGTAARQAEDGGAAPAEAPPAVTRYLVLVDEYFGDAAGRARVLARLRGDLALLGDEDPVAVVGWDGRRLDVVTPWTTDRGEIDRALDTVAGRRGRSAAVELRGTVTSEQRIRLLADQLDRTYRAMTAALQGFAGGSGRSVALLVSGGWPFDPAGRADDFRVVLAADTREAARRLAAVANASGFTLYPIDAPGAQPDPTITAALGGLDDTGAGLQPLDAPLRPGEQVAAAPAEPAAVDRRVRAFDAAWQEFDAESTLLLLAEETGGVALINGERFSALRQAVADLSSYYRLGFYHSSRADGAVRRIEVEVARDELTVRSRRSFADLTTADRARVALEQALLLGRTAGTDPLWVWLGEGRPAGRRQVEVPFEVRIPMGQVTTTPAGEGRIATSLELHVAVEDEEGRRNTVATLPIELEVGEAAVGGHVTWAGAVRLRSQGHEVLFALSDPASGRVWVGRTGFDGGA
ncbi:MAG TPA: VWA domain-containing protein [Thermoanaerobaculia bacterium]|nr:VWA domain-containing protein [Thermoanaerobaculia bacterium]